MAWLRIDDKVRTHPKIAQAGPAAAWLWFCGICYCREHLTDGLIPKPVVPTLALNLPNPWRHAAKLVEVQLWEAAPNGYSVHDFLDWNPSRQDVLSLRDKERDKKRNQRGHTGDSRGRADTGAGDAGLGSLSGSDAGSEIVGGGDGGTEPLDPASTPPPVWGRRGSGALVRADTLVGDHRRCLPAAAEACGRGVCVPAFLAQQWAAQLRAQALDPDAAIRRLVADELARVSGVIGDDPLKFWRAAWSARHGSQAHAASPVNGRGNASRDAMARTLARRAARMGGQP